LINDILDYSKIEAGKLDLDPIPFKLRDCVGDAAKVVAYRAHQTGLELAYWIAPDVEDDLIGDPGRVRQILLNLAGNAVKFTREGEVIIKVEKQSETEDQIILRFTVKDTGIGIPEDKLSLIFDPFSQADSSTTREFGGTGLGLAISRQLVEMMGGEIWVESEVGTGSTFYFTVNFTRVPEEERTVDKTIQDMDPSSLKGLNVLVVDDNSTNRFILYEMLQSMKMSAMAMEDSEETWKHLKSLSDNGEVHLDLVILDAQMPKMSGFDLAQKIKSDTSLKHIPIMVITSSGRRGDAALCRELGLAAYLIKPVKQSELREALLKILHPSAREIPQKPLVTRHSLREQRPALRILLAEDNPVNRKMAVRMLEKRGHEICAVRNGREAIEAYENGMFDLVLMDVQMPEIDGFSATAKIREKEKSTGDHIPIIAMTAHAMKGDRERCLAAGMDEYMSKPIKAERLFATVEMLFRKKERAEDKLNARKVDLKSALEHFDGDRELLAEMAGIFQDNMPQQIIALKRAVSEKDFDVITDIACSLESSFTSLGSTSGVEYSRRLQEQSSSKKINDALHVISQLETEFDYLRSFYSDF
jgi:CheY-like chemotaxis protein